MNQSCGSGQSGDDRDSRLRGDFHLCPPWAEKEAVKVQKTGTEGPTLGMGQQRGHLVLLLPPNFEFQSVLRTWRASRTTVPMIDFLVTIRLNRHLKASHALRRLSALQITSKKASLIIDWGGL